MQEVLEDRAGRRMQELRQVLGPFPADHRGGRQGEGGEVDGGITPLIPEWGAVENEPNPIKSYLTAVMNGD
ncbi:hypothetical protein, partial [Streptomyces spectabilis]|uniref:hypothetical protein n=1 Tax=Streptomyces spectabilis TaxID=68270 RepID=UPI0033C1AD1C